MTNTETPARTAADLAASEILTSTQTAEDAVLTALSALESLENHRPEAEGQVYYTRNALKEALAYLRRAWDEAPEDGINKGI